MITKLVVDRLHSLVELVEAPRVAVARRYRPAAFCLRPCSIEPKIYKRNLESRRMWIFGVFSGVVSTAHLNVEPSAKFWPENVADRRVDGGSVELFRLLGKIDDRCALCDLRHKRRLPCRKPAAVRPFSSVIELFSQLPVVLRGAHQPRIAVVRARIWAAPAPVVLCIAQATTFVATSLYTFELMAMRGLVGAFHRLCLFSRSAQRLQAKKYFEYRFVCVHSSYLSLLAETILVDAARQIAAARF